MINTQNKLAYKAFGLNVISEILLPELPKAEVESSDISIEYRDLTGIWNNLIDPKRYFNVNENSVLFRVPNTATFYVENGDKILISPMAGFQEDQVRLYVLGTCMGALLLQRKTLPLHGSAIAINGKAYAIVGDSGSGKSTLASAFLDNGYQLISDDVIPVHLTSDGVPIVTPSYPQQKLWQESLDAFGRQSSLYRPIYERETKFSIPVNSQFSPLSLPLAGVFELNKTDNNEITINPILNLERLHTLFNHTYRNFLMVKLGLMEWHFHLSAKIADNIQFYKVERPISRFTANDLTTIILNTLIRSE